jgi:hypothetical protein
MKQAPSKQPQERAEKNPKNWNLPNLYKKTKF